MKTLVGVVLCIFVGGCSAGVETTTEIKPDAKPAESGGVAPMGGVGAAAGGVAPVQGAENIGGGSGGGVGQAATGMARRAASAESTGTESEGNSSQIDGSGSPD